MKDRIIQFMESQTCCTICCLDENSQPYCFNAYYALEASSLLLLYKSSPGTSHGKFMETNHMVAGTILPDKLSKLSTQGIQFTGAVLPAGDPANQDIHSCYYKKFPMAHAISGTVHCIRLDTIKMTDSTLGFGKKILWSREAATL